MTWGGEDEGVNDMRCVLETGTLVSEVEGRTASRWGTVSPVKKSELLLCGRPVDVTPCHVKDTGVTKDSSPSEVTEDTDRAERPRGRS